MTPWFFLVPGSIDRPTGGSRYDRSIVTGLREQGIEVTVAELDGTFPAADHQAQQATGDALAAIPNGSRVIVDGLVLAALPDVFAQHAARLVLIALVHHPVADETGLEPPKQAEFLAREARGLGQVHGVIATSQFTAARLKELALYAGPIAVVEPGCSQQPIASGSDSEVFQVLCLGSLIPRKGQHILVEALATLTELPWQCHCVGSLTLDARYAEQVQTMIRQHRLQSRVTLTGILESDALDHRFHRSDIFVLPSLYEGYGMVITEAIARGLPVVTTKAGALPQTLPAEAGITVTPDDPSMLAKALARLFCDDDFRQQLRDGALGARMQLIDWPETAHHFYQAAEALTHHA